MTEQEKNKRDKYIEILVMSAKFIDGEDEERLYREYLEKKSDLELQNMVMINC
jgi:hypothetical protein